jgi:hypothetical protein
MRYHFHIVDENVSLNVDIAELASYEEVLDRGTAIASKLVHQEPYSDNPAGWEIRVTDEDGREILSIPMSDAPQ